MQKQNRDYDNFISFVNEIVRDKEFQPIGCLTNEKELKEKYGMTTTEFTSHVVKLQKMYQKFIK